MGLILLQDVRFKAQPVVHSVRTGHVTSAGCKFVTLSRKWFSAEADSQLNWVATMLMLSSLMPPLHHLDLSYIGWLFISPLKALGCSLLETVTVFEKVQLALPRDTG